MTLSLAYIELFIRGKCPGGISGYPHGYGWHKLHEVARMPSLAMLLYASSSWWGFTLAQDRQRLESMVRRMIRWGFLADDDAPTFESLVSAADQRLFKAIRP